MVSLSPSSPPVALPAYNSPPHYALRSLVVPSAAGVVVAGAEGEAATLSLSRPEPPSAPPVANPFALTPTQTLPNASASTPQTPQTTLASQSTSQPRTPGLWAFDTLLYPVLTNAGVFAISVYATYQSTFGKKGNWLQQRGEVCRQFLHTKLRLPKGTAASAVMMAWSFLDGCVMAPAIKLLEDRRGPLSRKLDAAMGTTPADDSVYAQEPKQSWGSVLAGRATASVAVLPTWMLLEQKLGGSPHSINEHLFKLPAQKLVANLQRKAPQLHARLAGRFNAVGLAHTALFEAFYTCLCTGMLYGSSRAYAAWAGDKQAQAQKLA